MQPTPAKCLGILVAILLCALGQAPGAALTPEDVQREIEAATTTNVCRRQWGLSSPQAPVALLTLENMTAADKAMFPLLPKTAAVEQGDLVFELPDKEVVVGVGNCENLVPESKRPDLGKRFSVRLTYEQSVPGKTVWTLVPWCRGNRVRLAARVAKITAAAESRKVDVQDYLWKHVYRFCRVEAEGEGEHTLTIERAGHIASDQSYPADGFELLVRGPAGARIRIRNITASTTTRRGGFRKTFTVPVGHIWQATANVNLQTLLYVNGKEVPSPTRLQVRPQKRHWQGMQEVDLTSFLQPGPNVLAVRAAYPVDANAMMTASVIMESGEIVHMDTDPTWAYVPECVDGWNLPRYEGPADTITNVAPFSASHLPKELTAIRYGYRIYGRAMAALPAYEGRMRLKAPPDLQLFLSADRPFAMQVRSPYGLAERNPTVDWLLCRYHRGGDLEAVLSGTCDRFSEREGSIVFDLSDGDASVPMGPYVFKAVLRAADGTVIEARIPEPVLVTGKIPMGVTQGASYEDGLDLEQEAVIDFTQPEDPRYPWMEIDGRKGGEGLCEEPIVVTRNGLTYRETRRHPKEKPRVTARHVLISYNYKFEHPGDFYVMTLDYPDDEPRVFGVNLSSEHDSRTDHSKTGPTVWTGILHLNTGDMQTLKWMFRPDPGYTSINLINLMPGGAAAASKLHITHVKGNLPELATADPSRRFGFITESTVPQGGHGKTFRSSDDPRTGREMVLRRSGPSWEEVTRTWSVLQGRMHALSEWLDTCNHYTEYLRWAGQNEVCLGVYKYYHGQSAPISPSGDARVPLSLADVAARVLQHNDIDFLCRFTYCSDPYLQAEYAETTDLSESPFLIDRNGKEWRVWKTGYNFNHPAVRASMTDLTMEVARKFQALPRFRGIQFTTVFEGAMAGPNYFIGRGPLDPLHYEYSDSTVRRFEQDTGTDLPIPHDSPHRFAMRYKLLTSDDMREQWIEWRTRNMVAFFTGLRDTLRTISPNIGLEAAFAQPRHVREYANETGKPMDVCMREFGWDVEKFGREQGVSLVPFMYGTLGCVSKMRARKDRYGKFVLDQWRNTPAFVRIGDGEQERGVVIQCGWWEVQNHQENLHAQALLPKREHWQVPYQYTMMGMGQGDNALVTFMRAMQAMDVETLVYGYTDANYMTGHEQPLREFAQFLRSLPRDKFQPFDGPDAELVVRTLRRDGELLCYALNPAPWAVQATFSIDPARDVRDLVTGAGSDAPFKVTIPGYHGASLAARGDGVKLAGWSTQGTGPMFKPYVQHMRKVVAATADQIENTIVRSVLLPEQLETMSSHLDTARSCLDKGLYAAVWQRLNSWEFTWYKYFLDRQAEAMALITEVDPPEANLGKKTIFARRVTTPPVIDGTVDDAAWTQADVGNAFVNNEGKASGIGTHVRTAWDEQNLYLAFVCKEKFPEDLKADAEEEKEVMQDDSVVFLLQPDRDSVKHYQMAFNADGTRFDQRMRDYSFEPEWRVATAVTADAWTAEVAFPFAAMDVKPEAGDRWGVNFCRIVRMNKLPFSTWTYQPENWHDPEGYGVLTFRE